MAEIALEKVLTIEKILTISARDYCEMYGKSLDQYIAVGIHVQHYLHEIFAQNTPEGTEVVVDFASSKYSMDGTALIPKDKLKKAQEKPDYESPDSSPKTEDTSQG